MAAYFLEIQDLLQQRADYQARLNLMPYGGTPEIKEQGGNKYLYVRKRIAGKLTSAYVDVYPDELYQLLLRNAREARERNKNMPVEVIFPGIVRPYFFTHRPSRSAHGRCLSRLSAPCRMY